MNKDKFKERLKDLIGGEKPFPWAERIGITPGIFNRMWNDGIAPKAETLGKIASKTGVSIDWLLLGKGDKFVKNSVNEITPDYGINNDFILVPRYNVQASMGGGADVHSEQVVDHLAFKRSWLKEMDLRSDRLALITAMGDSMYPTIKDGCLMLVDTRKDQSINDGIYVLRWDGALLAKRLQRTLDGGFLVQSDNSVYKELKAEKDQLQLLDIIGRVVWSGGKI